MELGKQMKPGRRQTMNKIKKLYHHDRNMMVGWFVDHWPLFEYQLMDLIEQRVNELTRKSFLNMSRAIDISIKELNLDKPDNVIQFRRRA